MLAVSQNALAALDLDPNACETDEFVQVFSGNKVLDDTRPWALCYGGHQFGYKVSKDCKLANDVH